MAQGQHRDAARFLQAESELPTHGKFRLEAWAERFGRKRETALEWVKSLKVPVQQFGNETVVDAEKFWEQVPYKILE